MATSASPRGVGRRVLAWTLLAAACCLAPLIAAPARAARLARSGAPASATLVQCVTSVEQAERSATFAGEMTLVPGTTRMAMRVDIEKRAPDEARFQLVSAPGLGVWRAAAPGVKVYRYLKQVTNLSGAAFYRGVVRFRWLSAHGRLLASATLHTRRCEEPATSPALEPLVPSAPAPGA